MTLLLAGSSVTTTQPDDFLGVDDADTVTNAAYRELLDFSTITSSSRSG